MHTGGVISFRILLYCLNPELEEVDQIEVVVLHICASSNLHCTTCVTAHRRVLLLSRNINRRVPSEVMH